MISREPTLERLAIAEQLMLAPFGLDESVLARALATIGEHRVDDADLYFQTTRHEGWSLEEGIVKSGSFSIDQGVGVRAVAGEKTAFAYSATTSASIRCWTPRAPCARSPPPARASASRSRGRQGGRQPRPVRAHRPHRTLDSAQKVALLEKVEKLARAKDPRIVQVMAGASPPSTTWCSSRAPTARAPPTCGRWCACRSP
jgi:TldD protein